MSTSTTTSSADGTAIAIDITGRGPALVLVAGAFCDRQSKKGLTSHLADQFTVYEYDRRGRGASGPQGDNSIEHEVEDLASVIARTGEKPFVFGDSSGGCLAIAAAAAGAPVRSIAIYETPFTPGPSHAFADELTDLVTSGNHAEAAERFLALMGTPGPAIEHMKQGPAWQHLQSLAPTLPIDVRLCNDGQIPQDQLSRIQVPLLAIAGDQSPWAEPTAVAIANTVPYGKSLVLTGQGHAVPDDILAPILRAHFQ